MANHKTLIGALNAIERRLDTIPNNIAKAVKSDSESITPVRTGRLKAGYEIEESKGFGDDAKVINEVPYAIFQEFGTPKIPAKGMMRFAVSNVSPDARTYVSKSS